MTTDEYFAYIAMSRATVAFEQGYRGWWQHPSGGKFRVISVVGNKVDIEYHPETPINFININVSNGEEEMSEKPVCETCDGTKKVKCEACGGEGKYDCDECSGSGECPSCGHAWDGESESECSECYGDQACSNCGGDGDFDCEECDLGLGHIPCPDCTEKKEDPTEQPA